jgi:hypothetical protein
MGSWDMDLGVVKGWVCPYPPQWQVPSVSALLSFSEGLWFCVLDTSLLLPRRNTDFYCIPVPYFEHVDCCLLDCALQYGVSCCFWRSFFFVYVALSI